MKKVLSWVLVLALVLSSFTMAFATDKTANSSDMKDAAAIANVEAVDVMVATGIIGGYPDGYYYPEKAVTRAEMAKMISVAVNGGEDVGAYYADSCTFADSANHWAAGYIAYCANEGIIDGRDANTFDPDATVTGLEAAKMMLVAIGYDSKIEGFTGGQWAGNVLKAAKANKLFDGCDDFNSGAALDRDNAAQVIFNGLQADTVEYSYDAEISTGDTTITVNTAVEKVMDGGNTVPLYKASFTDPALVYETTGDYAADDFGRGAHGWSYDGKEVGVYADAADYTFVVTEAGALDAVAIEEWDEEFLDDNSLNAVKYNGATGAVNEAVVEGDVVELYETANAGEYDAVVIHYDIVQIAVDTDVTDAHIEDGISAYVDFGNISTNDTKLPGFDAATYVDEAIIAVAYYDGTAPLTNDITKVIDTYVPEVVTGEVTKLTASAAEIFVDGTGYDNISGEKDFGGVNNIETEKTYDFYFINGYIAAAVYVEGGEATDLYGVFLGSKSTAGFGTGTATYEIKLVDATGDEVVLPVEDTTTVEDAVDALEPAGTGKLVTYTLNDDGEVDAIVPATDAVAYKLNDVAMKTNGILNAKKVSEDVVAFFYDSDAEEWVVYGYADLEAAEGITADFTIFDTDAAEYVAMLLKADIVESSDDSVLALVTDAKVYNEANSKLYYELTALVDGKEVTYTTVSEKSTKEAWTNGTGAEDKFCVLTLNSEGKVTGVALATAEHTSDIIDSFAADVNIYQAQNIDGDYPKYTVDGKSGSSLDIAAGDGNYNYLAIEYLYVFDGSDWTVEKLNTLVFDTDQVMFIQTSEDASVWSIAIKGSVTPF